MINATRSPKPEKDVSLERETGFRSRPVKRQLKEDFASKCYLCENRVEQFQVDHLKPAADNAFPELKYEWSNLFFACPTCNNGRKKKWATPYVKDSGEMVDSYPEGGLLDCTEDDVEERLRQILRYDDGTETILFQARNSEDLKAQNTATELSYLHMDSGESYILRDTIKNQIRLVDSKIKKLMQWIIDGEQDTEEFLNEKSMLRHLLSRRAPFTALMRSYFTVDAVRLPPCLGDVLD